MLEFFTADKQLCASLGRKMQSMPDDTTTRVFKAMARWLLFSVLASCACLCDAPRALAQEYVFRDYRQTSGLENLAINSVAADSEGFLWVATENGLYRFLGSNLQRFGAAQGIGEPYITQVFAASDGTLWAASNENLYRWGGQVFSAAASQPVKLNRSSSMGSYGPGRLLVISQRELYRLNYSSDRASSGPGRLEKFFSADLLAAHPSLGHLGAITVLPDGTIWMSCAKMLCLWTPHAKPGVQSVAPSDRQSGLQDGVLTEWAAPQGVAPELYRSIFEDAKGVLWAVSLKHIVALLPGALPSRTSNQPHPAFVDRSLPSTAGNGAYSRLPIACDPKGRVIVSMAGGIARWNGSGWETIGKNNGFISSHLTALLFDGRGNLWMGSIGHGLYRWIGYDDWQGWIDNQGLPSSNIWSVGPFNGSRVWIGTEKGLAILDTRTGLVAQPAFARNWPYGQVSGIIEAPGSAAASFDLGADGNPAGGTLLISTLPGKLLKVEGHPARVTLIADLQDYIYQLLRDPSGRTFLIADSGVRDVSAIFQQGSKAGVQGSSSLTRPRPLPGSAVPQINSLLGHRVPTTQGCASPDGTVWFLGESGLVRLAHEAGRDVWSRPSLQGLPNPLPRLSSLACSQDGALWITAGGASIWHAVYSQGLKGSANASASDGTGAPVDRLEATRLDLPRTMESAAVVDLLADPRGWLWVGTDDGVLAWNGAVWRHLTQEDGLIWNDVNSNKMANGPDGSIWVATSGGLSRIMHPEVLFATPPPRIAMIEARIDGRPVPLGGVLELPWFRQDLSFQFAAPDVINRAGLRFHYRLAGLQHAWMEGRDQTAHFQPLPPGEYFFEVYAQDSVSGARSGTINLPFRVLPPWWRTWWFYAVCTMAVCFFVALIYRLRTRHLLAQQRRLEGMVLKRTSELEASREELRRQATHDGLTGLLNRAAVLEAFDQELAGARRDGTPVTVVLADIDHFKHINDTYGHLAGDEALRRFSAALAAGVRPYDHVGRYGGEEFLLVLVHIDSNGIASLGVKSSEVQDRLAALHKSISGLKVIHDGAEFVVNCSLGVVQLDDLQGGSDQKLALAAVDEALYEAKRGGRNRFVFGHLASETLQ